MTYSRWHRTRIFTGPTYTVEVYRRRLWRDWQCTVISNVGTWEHRMHIAKRARDALAYVRQWTSQ